jgi:hypothetical protein
VRSGCRAATPQHCRRSVRYRAGDAAGSCRCAASLTATVSSDCRALYLGYNKLNSSACDASAGGGGDGGGGGDRRRLPIRQFHRHDLTQPPHRPGSAPALSRKPSYSDENSCESQRSALARALQKTVVERWTNPNLSRRTCSPRHGLQPCRGNSAGVAKRPREFIAHPKRIRFATFFIAAHRRARAPQTTNSARHCASSA